MDLLQKLNETFAKLQVNPAELPAKTKNKISTLKKTIESKLPTYRTKEGKFTPAIAQKITDLIDDIIAEAEAFSEEKGATPPATPPPGTPPATPPPADPPKKGMSFWDIV